MFVNGSTCQSIKTHMKSQKKTCVYPNSWQTKSFQKALQLTVNTIESNSGAESTCRSGATLCVLEPVWHAGSHDHMKQLHCLSAWVLHGMVTLYMVIIYNVMLYICYVISSSIGLYIQIDMYAFILKYDMNIRWIRTIIYILFRQIIYDNRMSF